MPSDRPERIGLFANWDLRRGPGSALLRFVREFEPYWREVLRPEIYAIEGSYRALLRHGLLLDYPHLHALPAGRSGGIVNLGNRVVRAGSDPGSAFGIDSVIYFIDPRDPTSLFPDSLALKRECVVTGTTFLANYAAASEWYTLRWCVESLDGKGTADSLRRQRYLSAEMLDQLFPGQPLGLAAKTIALVAHDTRKSAMLEFAAKHYSFLSQFVRRLATGTTGALLNGEIPDRLQTQWDETNDEAELFQKIGHLPTRLARTVAEHRRTEALAQKMAERLAGDAWVEPQPSGPKGGDIQIADEVREGNCHSVVFFEDPHVSREHEADIQLLERTTRIPECEALCLHDPSSAEEWALNWGRCIEAGVTAQVSLFDAFRRLWGVELVLGDPSREAQSSPEAKWRAVVYKAAWYVHGLLTQRALEAKQRGERAQVGVTWGIEMYELLDALEKIPKLLKSLNEDNRALSRPVADHAQRTIRNTTVGPLIGIMGTTDPRNEANHNAHRLAEQLRAESLSLSQFAYCDKRHAMAFDDPQRADVKRHWANLDVALLSCDRVKSHFSTRASSPVPESLHEQMVSSTVAEIGGIYLTEGGEEVIAQKFQRVGVTLRELRGVADRRGAILIAGVQTHRLEPTLAALRAGMVSSLVTDIDFARALLEHQAASGLDAHAIV